MTVIEWLSCLWWNLMHMCLWYLYVYVTPLPNDYVYRFNHPYNFWNNKVECMWVIRYSCAIYITVYIFFSVWLFFQYYTPFCFLRIWNIVLNGWNSYCLCSDHCLRYSVNVSTKVDIEIIFWCSVLMDCSLFLLFHLN